MFDVVAGRFAFDVFMFDVFDVIGVAVFIGVAAFTFVRLALALLAVFVAASPQAIPKTLKTNRADKAIAFFITYNSPVFSRDSIKFARRGGLAPKLFLFLEQTKS
jgi:hypothetical protein